MRTDSAGNRRDIPIRGLTCIELPSQIPAALEFARIDGRADTIILALTPHVELELKKLGHSCIVPEQFHDEDDINQVGFQNIDALEGFTKYTDEFMQAHWSLLAEEDLNPTSLNWYYLKLLFNTISIRSFIIQRVLHEKRPKKVLFFDSQEEPFGQELYFYRESPWSKVIPLVCRESGVSCVQIPGNTDISELWRIPGRRSGGLRPAAKMAARQALGPTGLRLFRRGIRTLKTARTVLNRIPDSNHSSRNPSILVLDRGYSLGQAIQIADDRQELDVFHWDGSRFVPPYAPTKHMLQTNSSTQSSTAPSSSQLATEATRLWRDISNQAEFNSFLNFAGVDCRPALLNRLRRFFEDGIPQLITSYFNGQNLARQLKPGAVVTSVLGDYKYKAFAVGARKEGVPVVVYRHGDSSAHLWGGAQNSSHWKQEKLGRRGMYIERNELPIADYILAFGQGDVAFLDGIKKTAVEIIPVGSAALDNLKITTARNNRYALHKQYGMDPNRRTVMYVPPIMEGGVRSAPYQLRSPGLMNAIQERLVETFNHYPDIQFVIKARESDGHTCPPIVHQLNKSRPANCVVITAPFPSVIGMADMFVIDVASTMFLEMLTTDKPILLCAHQLSKKLDPAGWSAEVRDMWNERVTYSTDLDEFIQTLHRNLEQDIITPVQSTDTLLKLFGTHKNDGASARRAYDFLLSLASR